MASVQAGPVYEAPVYGVNVRDFGAQGDGIADDGPAIQRALDAGQALVIIPYGSYKISETLRIGSDTRLRVHPGAQLRLADGSGVDSTVFLLTNRDHAAGNCNIRVEGGIWDGNNSANLRGPDAPGSYTGVLINFSNVRNLTLSGLTLRDAESYFMRFDRVTDFRVEEITFQIRHLRPNQDGLHLAGYCEDGLVRHLRAYGPQTPNDDMVALVADDALGRAQNLGACNGPIRRIRIEDIQADSCHSFVRLLSFENPIEAVEIRNVRGGCRCCAINMDACRDCRVKLFDEADYPEGVGRIADVRVQGMHVYKASDESRQPLIDFRTRVESFVIEDFQRDAGLDVSPATPTLRITQANAVDLTLEGLLQAQIATMSRAAPNADVKQIASPSNQTTYRFAWPMTATDSLTLPAGGFALLTANLISSS